MPSTPCPVESDGSREGCLPLDRKERTKAETRGIYRISTTELLEQILLHLDMQTLLVSAIRVCRAWNSLITTSPRLQRALFLLPEDDRDASNTNTIINPLLAKHFPPFFTPVYDIGCPFPIRGLAPDEGCYDYLFEDVSYNGMSNFKSMPVYQVSMANNDFIDHDGQDPNANAKARENNPYLRECASWRNMLTSQPPARKLGYCMLSTGGNSTIASTKILSIKCRKDGDGQGGSIEVNSAANQNPPIRMANLYAQVLLYMKMGSKHCGFKIMCNLQNHDRDYVTQYASLPYYPSFAWMEDHIGVLYNQGADIVLQHVVRPRGCLFMGSNPEADAVWWRCQPESLQSGLFSEQISKEWR
ncbi:hypothetical protein BDV32DRAFT_138602 [Aspergillus pseudonomiae]|uniref:F-box domain-containing protein n=1 Tax=Aspergillus pseudonomiae TaxID=1506151 RepID=A0A5N6I448_9EURO|nr:uncharacterized protein BDV37DRAFT_290278 [Aspergillus pseudonomiae]KAB8259873.1 hypothetical protein BDV32DRAFT_138602 [Aspergillus pseudonomiae]KAE8407537.1 hypothetical protein BDV37DRAFT_290278 [Aspergillus pseudonomiae]